MNAGSARVSLSASRCISFNRRSFDPERDPAAEAKPPRASLRTARLLLRVPAREDRRHVVEHVRRAHFVVAEVADEPALDDVDLLLSFLVNHRADQRLELDAVLLVLEQLELE